MITLRATAELLDLMRRIGCDPPRCHACEGIYYLEDELAEHPAGCLTHLRCARRGAKLRLDPPAPEERKRIMEAVRADPNHAETPQRGCWLSQKDLP